MRVQLEPIINWLGLSEDKAADLIKARRALIQEYGGPDTSPAKLILEARKDKIPDKATREKLKKITTDYMEFQTKWIKAVEALLTEEQKTKWQTRYRRTLHAVGGGL